MFATFEAYNAASVRTLFETHVGHIQPGGEPLYIEGAARRESGGATPYPPTGSLYTYIGVINTRGQSFHTITNDRAKMRIRAPAFGRVGYYAAPKIPDFYNAEQFDGAWELQSVELIDPPVGGYAEVEPGTPDIVDPDAPEFFALQSIRMAIFFPATAGGFLPDPWPLTSFPSFTDRVFPV